ncbi:LysR family transcriptional regulator [Ligilactobacillus sp. WC1T17]|uniref:LysR family transcriptional regulator n=1 Tax=Ligilactobacillus sp. WC1T17 TaxID=3158786 RepID=UPI00399D58B6
MIKIRGQARFIIKALENELGFTIFDRTNKKVFLTQAGEQFCHGLKQVNEALLFLIEQCQNFANNYQKQIKISTITDSFTQTAFSN